MLAENARQLHVSIRTAFLFNVFILSFCKREEPRAARGRAYSFFDVLVPQWDLRFKGAAGFIDGRRFDWNKISAGLAAFFPVSFHSHVEVRDFFSELPLNRSFLDLAGARIQRFFQAVNLFRECHLFRNR
jgi:hypothetical protein